MYSTVIFFAEFFMLIKFFQSQLHSISNIRIRCYYYWHNYENNFYLKYFLCKRVMHIRGYFPDCKIYVIYWYVDLIVAFYIISILSYNITIFLVLPRDCCVQLKHFNNNNYFFS